MCNGYLFGVIIQERFAINLRGITKSGLFSQYGGLMSWNAALKPILSRLAYSVVIVCCLAGCKAGDLEIVQACDDSILEKSNSVPLIRLVANPEPYEGQCVVTYGYMAFGFERNHIYMTYDAYEKTDIDFGAQIRIPDPGNKDFYDEKYYKDHEGLLIGTVENYVGHGNDQTIIHLYKTEYQILGVEPPPGFIPPEG